MSIHFLQLKKQMAEPTLNQVFGANATQTATQLIISKTDLAEVSLTASGNNTAESLLVAILLKAAVYLSTTNQANNSDISVTLADSGFPTIVIRNSLQFRQITYNINLQKIDTGFTIDPDDY